ncbi:MAG: mechanosensitive ion channel family protein [Candidatus Xenolissoclinum pacificiensis L6]|uniref:Mechanosensitive ion channel family protein n=1 Tax=Candidatus Xenolissoclinum pacificiensis L6 TaxID=1401685 RepID=W2V0W4_9RICK|nr:MAG: mechanosensitive ion channel family protein [Candidatus Xenolissoclinum pacificiensis L6]
MKRLPKYINIVLLVYLLIVSADIFLAESKAYTFHVLHYTNIARSTIILYMIIQVIFLVIDFYYERVVTAETKTIYKSLAFRKLIRICIYLVGIVFLLDILGMNINTLLTFGGISGIIIGFASKDSVSNFFGFVSIALDSPFQVGDMVHSDDRNIDGTVASINWRYTKIMTFEKRPIYVPNAFFSTIIIRNDSRMLARRYIENLRIVINNNYDHSIQDIYKVIYDYVHTHDKIIENEEFMLQCNIVYVSTDFFDVMLYLFFDTREWSEYLALKQELLSEISKKLEKMHVKVVHKDTQIELSREFVSTSDHKST